MKIFECTRLCVYVSLSSAPTTPRWLGGRPADSGRRLRRSVAVELAGDSARRLPSGTLNTNRMCSTPSTAARDVLNAIRPGCAQRHPPRHGMCSMPSARDRLDVIRSRRAEPNAGYCLRAPSMRDTKGQGLGEEATRHAGGDAMRPLPGPAMRRLSDWPLPGPVGAEGGGAPNEPEGACRPPNQSRSSVAVFDVTAFGGACRPHRRPSWPCPIGRRAALEMLSLCRRWPGSRGFVISSCSLL